MGECYLGIEIGGTKLQAVLGNADARILERRRAAVDPSRGATPIRAEVQRAIKELAAERAPRAIGVGFGGPVDIEAGRIAVSHQVEGWAGFDLVAWLEQATGLPVQVENDANAAALAEAIKGAGKDYSKVFYVTLGSGMGGGMVVDGRIYHGARPGEAEIGLVMCDKSGANLESRCCGWAVDRKVRRHVSEHPDSILARLAGQEKRGEARFLLPAIEQGDAGARAILEETCDDIAFGLSHVVHLLHPEVLILGGGLSLMGEPLRAEVAQRLGRFVTAAFQPGPDVMLSALGEDVVCVGALLLAQQKGRRSFR